MSTSRPFTILSQFGTKCYDFWYAEVKYQYHVMATSVLIGSMVAFWPFIAGYHDTIIENSIMRTNVHSIENIVASTVLITLALPLTIDGILDFTLSLLMDRNKAKENTDILNYIERTFIYSGLFIHPLCTLVNQQYADLGLLALCCSRFQYCIIYGGCFMSVSRIAPDCFSCRLCMLALGAYYTQNELLSYAYLHDKVSSINPICVVLQYVVFLILVCMLIHWIWLHHMKPYCAKRTLSSIAIIDNDQASFDQKKNLEMSLNEDIVAKNNMFVLVMAVIVIICTIILLSDSADYVDFTAMNLALVHIAFSLFALGLLIYHLRKFRSDAVLRLHALVNKKATLLKYVHELYGPISTIYESQKNMMEELGQVSTTVILLNTRC